ncbi:hypothetical protein KGM48_01970 [Patescibacteria group bacterium]|nr:hypothetical protein [Patescibacteria group bacterium]
MAPPTLPTSFLPQSASSPKHDASETIIGVLAFLGYVVAGAIFVFAIGVFLYGRVLLMTKNAEDAQLAKAVAALDTSTVPAFVRLHDRLVTGMTLVNNHVALSGFFPILEAITPGPVRFNTIRISFNDKHEATLDAAGTAQNFNALAATSAAFAADNRFKGAIFSGIVLNQKDGSVAFTMSAALDPKVIAFTP